jgi:hypothetical protein
MLISTDQLKVTGESEDFIEANPFTLSASSKSSQAVGALFSIFQLPHHHLPPNCSLSPSLSVTFAIP